MKAVPVLVQVKVLSLHKSILRAVKAVRLSPAPVLSRVQAVQAVVPAAQVVQVRQAVPVARAVPVRQAVPAARVVLSPAQARSQVSPAKVALQVNLQVVKAVVLPTAQITFMR